MSQSHRCLSSHAIVYKRFVTSAFRCVAARHILSVDGELDVGLLVVLQ